MSANAVSLTKKFRGAAHAIDNVIKEAVSDFGLNPDMYDMLSYLASAGSCMGKSLQNNHVGTNYGYTSKKLQEMDLISTTEDLIDKRKTIFTLTDKGQKTYDRASGRIKGILQDSDLSKILEGIGAEKIASVENAARTIEAHLENL